MNEKNEASGLKQAKLKATLEKILRTHRALNAPSYALDFTPNVLDAINRESVDRFVYYVPLLVSPTAKFSDGRTLEMIVDEAVKRKISALNIRSYLKLVFKAYDLKCMWP